MNVEGRLDVVVAGERWVPVASLDRCGPDDPCYVVRIAEDGGASIQFGDGQTGRRPPDGGRIEATYEGGGGNTGSTGHRTSDNPLATLLDMIAGMVDVLERYLEQVYAEAYIETSGGRVDVVDVTDLPAALAGGQGELVVRVRVRSRRRRRTDRT